MRNGLYEDAIGLRIAIDYRPALEPASAGIGRTARDIVAAIASARPGADVTLLVEAAQAGAQAPFPVRAGPRLPGPLRGLWHAWAASLVWRGVFDAYYSTGSLVAPALAPRRSVVFVHDASALREAWSHTRKVRAVTRFLLGRVARRAARIVVNSAHTRDELVELFGIDPARVGVAHLGVAPAFRARLGEAEAAAARARLGLPARYVLAVSTVEPRKNVPGLLRAFARLEGPRREGLKLVVAGKPGWGREDLRALAASLGIEPDVRFAGYVADADLPALYACAAAFCLPSFHEGFGLPVLEAMASGVPVVTSRAAALPEVGGDAVLYADPRDPGAIAAALERVLADRDLASRLSEAGRARAAGFTWERCAERVMEAIEAKHGRS